MYMTDLQASVEASTSRYSEDILLFRTRIFSCLEAILAILNMDPKSGSDIKQFLQSCFFISVIYSESGSTVLYFLVIMDLDRTPKNMQEIVCGPVP
jgi:hypothetical protein